MDDRTQTLIECVYQFASHTYGLDLEPEAASTLADIFDQTIGAAISKEGMTRWDDKKIGRMFALIAITKIAGKVVKQADQQKTQTISVEMLRAAADDVIHAEGEKQLLGFSPFCCDYIASLKRLS